MYATLGIAKAFLSVHPSVCLSVKRVHCDKTKDIVPTFLYRMHRRSYSSDKKNGW